ncbi:MAG TPA: endonuclease/exonuclease/phosphatase family protein [Candidatus Saccharimonadales bacterium]
MAFTIATWNIEGRLCYYDGGKNRGTPETILAEIKRLNADVVVLPEVYLNAPANGVDDQLKAMGYSWYDTQYHDTLHDEVIKRWGHHFIRVLYRLPLVKAKTQRWGDIRDLPLITLQDPETKKEVVIIATHLDDLTEERRLTQVSEIIEYIKTSDSPIIMLGDFNAMWHEGWRRVLTGRFMRWVTTTMPSRTLRDVLSRFSRMATGKVMVRLRAAGMHDADPHHRATTTPKMRGMAWMPSIRLAQIDHILVRKGVRASKVIIGKDHGSDHRSLTCKITIQ